MAKVDTPPKMGKRQRVARPTVYQDAGRDGWGDSRSSQRLSVLPPVHMTFLNIESLTINTHSKTSTALPCRSLTLPVPVCFSRTDSGGEHKEDGQRKSEGNDSFWNKDGSPDAKVATTENQE